MNDRGQPVIHDIASKLGCIRPSPDLPYAFPEGADDFAELQAQLAAATHSDLGSEDRKHSEDSAYSSPALERTERASSSESDSDHSADYNQRLWAQQQQQQQQRQRATKANPPPINTSIRPQPSKLAQRSSLVDDDSSYSARSSFDATQSLPSPIYTDFATESPMFRNNSPFAPWSAGDDFLGQTHALDITSEYMRQPQFQIPRPSPLSTRPVMDTEVLLKMQMQMQMNDGLPGMSFTDGTIRPNMLDCNTGYDLNDPMDNIMFGQDYEGHMTMA